MYKVDLSCDGESQGLQQPKLTMATHLQQARFLEAIGGAGWSILPPISLRRQKSRINIMNWVPHMSILIYNEDEKQ